MNIFNSKPKLFEHVTNAATWRLGSGCTFIEPKENIVRPSGGGQPRDKAEVLLRDSTSRVLDVFKESGKTWLRIEGEFELEDDINITLKVDKEYRTKLSKTHTLTHVVMASLKHVVIGFGSRGADIDSEGETATLTFSADEQVSSDLIDQAEILARYATTRDLDVTFETIKPTKTLTSMNIAELKYPNWRINPGLTLSGKITVVNIAGLDSNPCSGSHVQNTKEIGPFQLQNFQKSEDWYQVDLVRSKNWRKWFADQAILNCSRINFEQLEF